MGHISGSVQAGLGGAERLARGGGAGAAAGHVGGNMAKWAHAAETPQHPADAPGKYRGIGNCAFTGAEVIHDAKNTRTYRV